MDPRNPLLESSVLDIEVAVRERCAAGAQGREEALCCPVDYDPRLLKVIPQEVLDRDYGCGDPSRHLKRGGRAVISDIVSDREVPGHLRADAELWSGCLSGAYQEEAFLRAFEDGGFYGVTLLKRDASPWRVVEGIEYRSVMVAAYKGMEGPCWDHGEAVIYRGPWKRVEDDDGHELERGVPTAVCRKSFGIFSREPYAAAVELLAPPEEVAEPSPFECGTIRRDAAGLVGRASEGCEPGCC